MNDSQGIRSKLEQLDEMSRNLQKNFKRLENQVATLNEDIHNQALEAPNDDRETWALAVQELSARLVDLEKSVSKLIQHAHSH
ncbi:MAG: hypothetical protein COY19_11975 [Candidatus Marinimicrobia bacterium CG_4_10_14_0_2_um_filter_48_9]|nr:MAG: hypothetical protein COY19_11975 [Candidatus Marinimicrobia bacterium CG_4_10_14_0_2_um_filter_48_9]